MANAFRKAAVFLGLAEEEEYDEYEQPIAPVAPMAPVAQQQTQRAPVTPLRRQQSRPQAPASMSEILTVHPRAYRDVTQIAETFREGVPVIMNLSQMGEAEAQRLIDFTSGLAEGLYGKIERITGRVFLLSPAHVATSGAQGEVETGIEAVFE